MTKHRWLDALVAAAMVLASGCGSSGGSGRSAATPEPGSIVYPPAPATPVIEWVGVIRERSDVGGGAGAWKRMLVGEDDQEPSLRAPTAVAIGPDDTLYVVDQQLRGVVVINRAAKRFDLFRGASPGSLAEPVGVAVADDGTLYVSDAKSQAVYAYDAENRFMSAVGGRDVFGRPTSLALSADGARLAVCDTRLHRVHVVDTATGQVVLSHGDRVHGDREGEFNFPVAVAFDEEGYLYVSDYLNFRIQVFDPAGDLDLVFGAGGDRPGDLNRPRGLVADAANGVLYEVDGAFQVVQMFNLDGELLMWFGEPGTGPGQFSLPSGIARRGELVAVADTLNRRVQLFRFLGAPSR
jgi:DNA-binding beta-propeller fold protein YncE